MTDKKEIVVTYAIFKQSLCGNQIRRDYIRGLSKEQIDSYPLGVQEDGRGKFVFGYCSDAFV